MPTVVVVLSFVAAGLLMLSVSTQNSFLDEYDNILAAKVLADGGFIYTGYFTQHMPLTYFLTYPIVAVFGERLLVIRVVFTAFLVLWTFGIGRRIALGAGRWYAVGFVLTVAVTFSASWSNMLMAETWIAWSVAHVTVLFWLRNRASTKFFPSILLMTVLSSIPVLSALAYLPVTVALYGMTVWWIVERRAALTVPRWVGLAAVAIGPYALVGAVLVVNGALADAVFQAVQFNTRYYAAFNPSAPRGAIDGVIIVLQIFFRGLWTALTDFGVAGQPIQFLLAVTAILGLTWLFANKRWVLASWLCVLVVFTGSRGVWGEKQEGFAALLPDNANARHAAGLFMVIIVIVMASVEVLVGRRVAHTALVASMRKPFIALVSVAALLVAVDGLTVTTTQMRSALASTGSIAIHAGPNSAAGIVNIVNEGTDGTYWMAPAEYNQAILVDSPSASRFLYFFDHVAACDVCFDEVRSDILTNQPRVMWFHPGSPFGPTAVERILDEVGRAYFTVDDPNLDGFYFLKRDRADILERLRGAGFDV
ncbi:MULTISPECIES: hypothetical protein [Microbacterium]|uniref:hypothetical protein n=1 Tax=Microbacterium TaxID=33882 RepID=UPI000D652E04|nr:MULTISPECIES: hypothetical protein [Microbacterium]